MSQHSALIRALRLGELEYVQNTLDTGFHVDTVLVDDTTMLISAIRHKKNDIVKMLLEKGADPNLSTDTCYQPLTVCAAANNPEAAELLIELSDVLVDAINEGGEMEASTAVRVAVREGNLEVVKVIAKHADIHADDEFQYEERDILYDAIDNGRVNVVSYLIDAYTFDNIVQHIETLVYLGENDLDTDIEIARILVKKLNNSEVSTEGFSPSVKWVLRLFNIMFDVENELQQWRNIPDALSDAIVQFATDAALVQDCKLSRLQG
jgi:ankyrin repeat protein